MTTMVLVRHVLATCCLFAALGGLADAVAQDELASFTRGDRSDEGGEVLFLSFDTPPEGLSVPAGYVCRAGEGLNGTGGLMLECPKGGPRPWALKHLKGLRSGIRYRLSAQLFVDGLTVGGERRSECNFTSFGLDFISTAGKCTCSSYAEVKVKDGKLPWTNVAVDFTLPGDSNGEADLLFFAYKQFGAKRIVWDNVRLERLGRVPPVLYPVWPKRLHAGIGGRVKMRVVHFREGADAENLVLFAKREDGKVVKAPVKDGCAELAMGKLPSKQSRVTFYLADAAKRTILAEDSYPFFSDDWEPNRRGCEMDESGRMFVDGKPFFPLGFHIEYPEKLTETELREMKEVGVNTLVCYQSVKLSFPYNHPPFGLAKVRRAMDFLHQRGFKVVFSLLEITDRIHHIESYEGLTDKKKIAERIVTEIRDHPALLAWFISDENPVCELGPVRALREQVAVLDPFHPILACAVRAEDYVWFGPTGDAMIVDNYPIYDNSPQSHSMWWIRFAFETQRDQCRMGHWWMQQGFCWGFYQRSRPYKEYRYPEQEEMFAQVLLSLNCRTRAVAFYAWESIWREEEFDPGSSVWFKPRVLKAVRFAHKLAPFFIVDQEPTSVPVVDAKGPLVEAKRHVAGKKVAVAVTSDGPGKASARVKVGRAGLKSCFGCLRDLGNGDYEFSSEGMSGDVLLYEEK